MQLLDIARANRVKALASLGHIVNQADRQRRYAAKQTLFFVSSRRASGRAVAAI